MSDASANASRSDGLCSRWFAPALGPLLRQRKLAVVSAAAGALQVAAGYFHFHTFTCPMLAATGVPCPGCGASRACGAMLRGDWHAALAWHVLAPCFLGAVLLFSAAALLPDNPRDRLAAWVDAVEARTGITKLLLLLLFLYWGARVMYAPAEFARAMRG